MKDISYLLKKLLAKKHLTEIESYSLFENFVQTHASQQAAVLTLLTSNGITAPEIMGALKYFLEKSVNIISPYEVIDIVGTGGDGFNTFNISTAASILVSSLDVMVAKHGGRSATSQSGSVDVVQELGIPLYERAVQINRSLEHYHYVYLCGSYFNPLLKDLAVLRKNLGFQTLLNILGPLANPLRPQSMLLGVYSKDLFKPLMEVLQTQNKKHIMMVHSKEGLDEISISGPSYIYELLPDGITHEYSIVPEDFGLTSAPIDEVIGGTPQHNARLIEGIFNGDITGAKLDIVLLNAASALIVADKVSNFSQGIEMAREGIISRKAHTLLNKLRYRK